MGFNFRKSINLGNGMRLNLGKKSASVSMGKKGVRHSVSTTGRQTTTLSVPGTGVSYSHTTGTKKAAAEKKKRETAKQNAKLTKEQEKLEREKQQLAQERAELERMKLENERRKIAEEKAALERERDGTHPEQPQGKQRFSFRKREAAPSAEPAAEALKPAPQPPSGSTSNPYSSGKAKKSY